MKREKPWVRFELTCGHVYAYERKEGDLELTTCYCMECEKLVPIKVIQPALTPR